MLNITFPQALAILGAILPFLVPLGQFLLQSLLQRLPANRHAMLNEIVNTVVSGVEQANSNSTAAGTVKKAQAVHAVTTIANAVGLGKFATPTLVDMLIESTVLLLNEAKGSGAVAASSQMGFVSSAPPSVPVPAL